MFNFSPLNLDSSVPLIKSYRTIVINSFQNKLSNCTEESEANDALRNFSDDLEKGLYDLEAVLHDASIATVVGSFDTLLKSSSPGWIAAALVESGKINNVSDVPVSWTIEGALVAGAVGVSKYLIDKRNERRAVLRNSPLSYVYSAQRAAILQTRP